MNKNYSQIAELFLVILSAIILTFFVGKIIYIDYCHREDINKYYEEFNGKIE